MMQPVYAYDPYNQASNIPMPVPVPAVPYQAQTVPGQVQFGALRCIVVSDPMTELATCKSVIIKQQPELLEMISGCETANRYHVLGNQGSGLYKYLFKCNERSDFCQRNCCPSNMREFNMEIFHAVAGPITGNIAGKFANAFKPFKCSLFCLNRPIIKVNLEANNQYIGEIKHLFSFCDPEFEVYNNQGLLYYVRADCCQCGLLCANNFCGKMSTATFEIYKPGTSTVLATISKMSAQSLGEMITDADSYQVGFPPTATPEEKLLLIALGLMIDYQYFETSSSDDNKGYGRSRYGYY